MLAVLGMPFSYHTAMSASTNSYPLHRDITVTLFWVGEDASGENHYIPNAASSWDDHWLDHYGGVDDPENRDGYLPADFAPRENPFYFALPYSDFQEDARKADAAKVIPWAQEKPWKKSESMCKNRWIKIVHDEKVAYAQWEDTGPFETDDTDYVFGDARPHSTVNDHAGLDVSPAVQDYLGLSGKDKADWQFVDEKDVPDGPWKQVVTTSQTSWD